MFWSVILYTVVFSLTKQDQALKIPVIDQKFSYMAFKKENHYHILQISKKSKATKYRRTAIRG